VGVAWKINKRDDDDILLLLLDWGGIGAAAD
jgi:hypothetical protein